MSSWSYCSWIYNYLCNHCLSPLSYEFEPLPWRGAFDTTLCDKVSHWLTTGRWFSPCTPVSSTNRTDRHDITDILLKVALNTIRLRPWRPLVIINSKVLCTLLKATWDSDIIKVLHWSSTTFLLNMILHSLHRICILCIYIFEESSILRHLYIII